MLNSLASLRIINAHSLSNGNSANESHPSYIESASLPRSINFSTY